VTDAVLWLAVAGTISVAITLDLIAVITWAQRVWAKLMEETTQ
jgi:hypothetical protein